MNDEERELYRQEVEWRSKEIEDLKFTLYKIRQAEALKKKPKNYLPMLGITGAFVFFSLIPGWNYGRNLWQTIAYYVNKTLWSNKDWWY
tara:strand:+ start:350 stop:616 length:267 start_codon:yes stop_codon:yes gene_type:complete